MKRNNLSLILPLILVSFATGCNSNQNDYSLDIVEQSVNVDLFSSYKLNIDTNTKGTILYSSNNPSVANVDENGLITTFSIEGEATISAKIGDYEDTCLINVIASNELFFEVNNDNIVIEKGYTFKIPFNATYNGLDVTDNLKLDYTSNDETIVKVVDVIEPGVIGLYGNLVGSTEITVYAPYKNGYISQLINVEVVSSNYVISSEGLEGGVGNYEANIYIFSNNPNHRTSLDVSNFKVYCSGVEIEEAIIQFDIADQNIIRLEGNKVMPVKIGTTTMTVSYLETSYEVKVNVIKETLMLDKNILIDKHIENVVDFSSDDIIGNIVDVRIIANDETIFGTYYSTTKQLKIDNDLIPIDTKYLSNQKLKIETDKAFYICESRIYTSIIRTLQDLKTLSDVCKVSDGLYEGYVILANDIDYELSGTPIFEMPGPTGGYVDTLHGFAGIFDGNGYAIKNYRSSKSYTSLFGSSLHQRGTITNLAITGVSLKHGKTSAITQVGYGTISNVYIQVDEVTSDCNGSGVYARWVSNAVPIYKGVVIDYGDTPIEAHTGFIPTTYQDNGKQIFAIVSGTYRKTNGVYYSSHKEMDDDLVNQRGYLPYPYWNNKNSLSFANYHTQSL